MNRKRSHGERTKEKESLKGGKSKSDNGFEEWGGYMHAKMAKLQVQFNESEQAGSESKIFAGVTININGHVNPTNLRTLFLQHGGAYVPFPTSSTDFVIAENLSEATKRKYGPKCVRPEWIVQSIAEGKKLDHRKFLLYNLNEENNQKTLMQVMEAFKAAHNQPLTKSTTTTTPTTSITVPTTTSVQKVPSPIKKATVPNDIQSAGPSHSNRTHDEKDQAPLIFKCWEDGFLEDFWSRSRLHQISTMKRIFQQFVAKCRRSGSSHPLPELELYRKRVQTKLQNNSSNISSHASVLFLIDMDCFFVSVGRLTRPHLANRPVAVTHFSGSSNAGASNSDIACASYEARKHGVRNGMWISEAKRLCPDIQVIPYEFQSYERVSKIFFEIVLGLTTEVEPGSCDEMLVDVTNVLQTISGSTPEDLAQFLRERIFEKTKCVASIGIGKNRLLAKLASKFAKPNGIYRVKDEDVPQFILGQSIKDIPGIGWNLMEKLSTQYGNIETCQELQQLKIEELKTLFGAKTGETIYNACRGIGERKLSFDFERPKSISIDVNFGIRMTEKTHLEKFAFNVAKGLCGRAEEDGARGTKLTLVLLTQQKGAPQPRKLGGHGYCDKHTTSVRLLQPSRDPKEIYGKLMSMLSGISQPISIFRGLGLQLTGLKFDFDGGQNKSVQQSLFSSVTRAHEKNAEAQKQQQQQKESNNNGIQDTSSNTNNNGDHREENESNNNIVEAHLSELNNRNPPPAATTTTNTTSATNSNDINGSSGPPILSPDQIDMSVLASLPEELASEIARDYGISKEQIDSFRASSSNNSTNYNNGTRNSHDMNNIQQEPIASTSRGLTTNIELATTSRPQQGSSKESLTSSTITSSSNNSNQQNGNVKEKDELNPFENMSQLDRSFLRALPRDVRQEVEINFVHMKHQKRVPALAQEKSHAKPKPIRKVIPKPKKNVILNSKNKEISGSASTSSSKTSPTVHESIPVIVQVNNDSNELQQPFQIEGSSYRAVTKYPGEEDSQVPFNRVNWWRFNGKDTLPTDKQPKDGSKNYILVKKKEPIPLILLPALNQRTDLAGVRNVIRIGMKSVSNPTAEDVNPLMEYFKQLIAGRFLQHAVVLMKFLKRLTESPETNSCWSKIFTHIISSTQQRCKNVFGCPVELDD